MTGLVVIAGVLGLVVLAIGALWLIGWAYSHGVTQGRRTMRVEMAALVATPEFVQELHRELQKLELRENLARYGTSDVRHSMR